MELFFTIPLFLFPVVQSVFEKGCCPFARYFVVAQYIQLRNRGDTPFPPGSLQQGCQMVYFQTKNLNLGKFWRGLAMGEVGVFYGHLVFLLSFGRYIVGPCGLFYGHSGYFSSFGKFCQEKSGNPGSAVSSSFPLLPQSIRNAWGN
jgi:hypothetical protein